MGGVPPAGAGAADLFTAAVLTVRRRGGSQRLLSGDEHRPSASDEDLSTLAQHSIGRVRELSGFWSVFSGVVSAVQADPVYMSRKIRKFRTDKFDT